MADTTGTTALSFSFSTQTLRVIMRNGEPWFVASDVAGALTIGRTDDAVARLDDDEKGADTVRTPGGQQEMTIINESGLYSLILTSRKPEAKKFKKWVTSEVLPAIRKTGRYEAPAAPRPMAAEEALTSNDMNNIRRAIYNAVRDMRFGGVWTQAVWFYLRRALALPAPAQFNVSHLPRIGAEMHRIVTATEQVHDLIIHIERESARRIFRKGESPAVVIPELERQASARIKRMESDMAELPAWVKQDVHAIARRTPNVFGGHTNQAEQLDFFGRAA